MAEEVVCRVCFASNVDCTGPPACILSLYFVEESDLTKYDILVNHFGEEKFITTIREVHDNGGAVAVGYWIAGIIGVYEKLKAERAKFDDMINTKDLLIIDLQSKLEKLEGEVSLLKTPPPNIFDDLDDDDWDGAGAYDEGLQGVVGGKELVVVGADLVVGGDDQVDGGADQVVLVGDDQVDQVDGSGQVVLVGDDQVDGAGQVVLVGDDQVVLVGDDQVDQVDGAGQLVLVGDHQVVGADQVVLVGDGQVDDQVDGADQVVLVVGDGQCFLVIWGGHRARSQRRRRLVFDRLIFPEVAAAADQFDSEFDVESDSESVSDEPVSDYDPEDASDSTGSSSAGSVVEVVVIRRSERLRRV